MLAREALEAIAKAKDAHQHNRDQNVAIIVKVPVIAMKYPMPGGQVTRAISSAFFAHSFIGSPFPDPVRKR